MHEVRVVTVARIAAAGTGLGLTLPPASARAVSSTRRATRNEYGSEIFDFDNIASRKSAFVDGLLG